MKETTQRFTMVFPQMVVNEPIMHKLSTDIGVVPNIVRGRITSGSARLEIEITGKQKAIDRAVKYLESRGVKVKKF